MTRNLHSVLSGLKPWIYWRPDVANCPDTETLALHLEDHILDIKLNRPESANAVNAPMWRDERGQVGTAENVQAQTGD